jgi:type IV pilus assembly protein PilA
MQNKQGFTLIELLIVVVIIGILAAIAIPRFGETRERAFRSSVTSDLRNLQTVQEQCYFDTNCGSGTIYQYETTDVANLNFQSSEGVAIALASVGDGYTATATHDALGTDSCVLTVGGGADGNSPDGIVCAWDANGGTDGGTDA